MLSLLLACVYRISTLYGLFAGYLQKGALRGPTPKSQLRFQLTRPPTNPRFSDFSYISDISSCLYLIKSSSWSKFRIVDELSTRGICGVGTFEEVARRCSATPQGWEVRSNGEKSSADDDDGAIVNVTTTTRLARRRFIFDRKDGWSGDLAVDVSGWLC